MSEQIVIVGAGMAGGWAAVSLRQSGFAGRIFLLGDEPERPYDRPPLSKVVLTSAEEPEPAFFHTAERYAELDISFRPNARVEGIDRDAGRVRLADGAEAYDKLLLVTGGRPRALPIPGGEHALLLRTWADARRIRAALATAKQVVCIGAGVIGLEVASSARQRGAGVIVLEAAPRAMGRALSVEGAEYMEGLHRKAGISLHFNQAVVGIEKRGAQGSERFHVQLSDGMTVDGDVVLAGIGIIRNTELAREAGLVVDNGIVVSLNTWTVSRGFAQFQAYLGLNVPNNNDLTPLDNAINAGVPASFGFYSNRVNWPQSSPDINNYGMR